MNVKESKDVINDPKKNQRLRKTPIVPDRGQHQYPFVNQKLWLVDNENLLRRSKPLHQSV